MFFLRLLIIIILCTFSFANTEQNNFYKLKKSKKYKQAYNEIIRLQNLKDGLFRPWTYIELGLLYEYGNGVKKSYKKSYEAYSTASFYKIPYSFSKLGYFMHNGFYVKKDRKEAFKYIIEGALRDDEYGMYLAGLYYKNGYGNVKKNPIAAKKWLQKAASKKAYAKKLLDKSTFNINSQIQKRKDQISKLNKDRSFLGIELGKTLYPELAVETTPEISSSLIYTWYKGSMSKSVFSEYIPKDERFLINRLSSKINVYTTPISNSVYEIDGFFDFNSQSSCKRELSNFLKIIKTKSKQKTFLSGFSKKKGEYESSYLDFGVYESPTPNAVDIIENIKNLNGTRFITKCFKNGKAQIRVIDFPSFELRVAESIQKDLFFSYLGQKRVLPPDYMKPFGITLLTPVSKSFNKRFKGKYINKNIFGESNVYSITPPKPLKNLTKYEIVTSKLTNSVVSVKAEGTFKDKEMCQIAMGTTAQNIFKHYSKNKKTLNWYNPRFSSPDNLYVEYFLTPKGLKEKYPIESINTIYGIDYSPSMQNVKIYIACEGRRGILQSTSQYGSIMAKKESELLFTHKEN